MAQQEDGWPQGLQPLNARVSLASSNRDHSGSVSFNTITASPSSSSDSSTESKGSCVHDNSITFGSLIGVSSILELSKRSVRGKNAEAMKENRINNDNKISKVWVFSLCLRDNVERDNTSSLGHFLAVERRAVNVDRTTVLIGSKTLDHLCEQNGT